MNLRAFFAGSLAALSTFGAGAQAPSPARDLGSDTWVATDALGRRLPTSEQVGLPRADRTVALFYFLWHGAHIQGGPYDVSKILAADPGAMLDASNPRWGPLHAPHHWGESIFGYYLTSDAGVLRKHAQMLGDIGVDVVVFDVTNQATYRDDYMALLQEWTTVRALGNRTPQVAFLTPFWDPAKVMRELWRDLYSTGQYRDLWFQWEGKPLVLADPDLVHDGIENTRQSVPTELRPGHTLGQSFTTDRPVSAVSARFPTWRGTNAGVTLTLFKAGPGGERVASDRFLKVGDNAWVTLRLTMPVGPGAYYFEASEAGERIGWWSHSVDTWPAGEAFADGERAAGDRTLRLAYADGEAARMREFFTFRKPQPDYFQGPTRPDMWSWLEVHPQHVFRNSQGEKEQMSVGVAQNAVNGRLGSMSEPGALGRSFHHGAKDPAPDAVMRGLNFDEQWRRALSEDPRVVFVTGWNEWIAGRFAEFNRVKLPVMFVDQFDQEHSRDIEPMKGGHGDNYYYQLAAAIRRYKGVRPVPQIGSGRIRIDGAFDDWRAITPEFRDTLGDPVRRSHRGWDPKVTYANATGRNDIELAKVSWDRQSVAFYVRTVEALSLPSDGRWMVLFLDVDRDPGTGWMGYDLVMNRTRDRKGRAVIERNVDGRYEWRAVGSVPMRFSGRELELSIPWRELAPVRPAVIDFKWADGIEESGDWSDFTLNGDAAPNDRFDFRARFGSE